MTKTCYYCGEPAKSGEHVPPKCIFPRRKDTIDETDYRKNLIKVPSCDLHNSQKSSDDEYLLLVLTMSISSSEIGEHHFLSRMQRALVKNPALLDKLFIKYEYVTIQDNLTGATQRTIAFKTDGQRLVSIFTHIGKAIYFHEFGKIWDNKLSVVTEFTLSFDDIDKNRQQNELTRRLDELLKDTPHKGNNHDAFSYQLMQLDGKTVLRLHFYERTKVTITGI